jgi:hypothetical protein
MRAEIARHGGNVIDGELTEADSDDVFEGPAARLIEAVLHFRDPSPQGTAMSPEHAALYREWRGLIEEHMRRFGEAYDAEVEAAQGEQQKSLEDRLAADMQVIYDHMYRILETPPRTWGDVLLYAEVAYWAQSPGWDPEGPNPVALSSTGGICDESEEKLIEAIFSVAGIGRHCT